MKRNAAFLLAAAFFLMLGSVWVQEGAIRLSTVGISLPFGLSIWFVVGSVLAFNCLAAAIHTQRQRVRPGPLHKFAMSRRNDG